MKNLHKSPRDLALHHRSAIVFGRLLAAGLLGFAEIQDAYGDMEPEALNRVTNTVFASADAWDARIDAMLAAPPGK